MVKEDGLRYGRWVEESREDGKGERGRREVGESNRGEWKRPGGRGEKGEVCHRTVKDIYIRERIRGERMDE